MSKNSKDFTILTNMAASLASLQDVYQDFSVQYAHALMLIAREGEVRRSDLGKMLDVSPMAASRICMNLSTELDANRRRQGWGLIEGRIDPTDRRHAIYQLTPEGKDVVERAIKPWRMTTATKSKAASLSS